MSPRIVKLMVLAWISPLFAMCWAAVTLLFARGRWRHKLFGLSIVGNLAFAFLLIVGYYEASDPETGGPPEENALVAPECIQRRDGPLEFCEAPEKSELGRIVPNAIYVAFDGTIRARFEFVDDSMGVLKEVTMSDKFGRPWIDGELDNGRLIFSRYADEREADPEVSLMDKDGDGIPDTLVNWKMQARFEREGELAWRRIDRE